MQYSRNPSQYTSPMRLESPYPALLITMKMSCCLLLGMPAASSRNLSILIIWPNSVGLFARHLSSRPCRMIRFSGRMGRDHHPCHQNARKRHRPKSWPALSRLWRPGPGVPRVISAPARSPRMVMTKTTGARKRDDIRQTDMTRRGITRMAGLVSRGSMEGTITRGIQPNMATLVERAGRSRLGIRDTTSPTDGLRTRAIRIRHGPCWTLLIARKAMAMTLGPGGATKSPAAIRRETVPECIVPGMGRRQAWPIPI